MRNAPPRLRALGDTCPVAVDSSGIPFIAVGLVMPAGRRPWAPSGVGWAGLCLSCVLMVAESLAGSTTTESVGPYPTHSGRDARGSSRRRATMGDRRPRRAIDGLVVRIRRWTGRPSHGGSNLTRGFAGLGDDLVQVATALLAAERVGASAVSFQKAEKKRQLDYPQGFDEIFPYFPGFLITLDGGHRRRVTHRHCSSDSCFRPALRDLPLDIRYLAKDHELEVFPRGLHWGMHTYWNTSELRRTMLTHFTKALPAFPAEEECHAANGCSREMVGANSQDTLVIHLRGGDALTNESAHWRPPPLPFAAYDRVISELRPKRIRIVTLPPPLDTSPVIAYLQQHHPGCVELQMGSVRAAFDTFRSATNLLIDYSGLSWFGALLNERSLRNVYVGHFYGRDGVDYMPNGARSDIGYTFPADVPGVRRCVIELAGAGKDWPSAARHLRGMTKLDAMREYMESAAVQDVELVCQMPSEVPTLDAKGTDSLEESQARKGTRNLRHRPLLHIAGFPGGATATVMFLNVINQITYAETYGLTPWVHLQPSNIHVYDPAVHGVEAHSFKVERLYASHRDVGQDGEVQCSAPQCGSGWIPTAPIQNRTEPFRSVGSAQGPSSSERHEHVVHGNGIWSSYFEPIGRISGSVIRRSGGDRRFCRRARRRGRRRRHRRRGHAQPQRGDAAPALRWLVNGGGRRDCADAGRGARHDA